MSDGKTEDENSENCNVKCMCVCSSFILLLLLFLVYTPYISKLYFLESYIVQSFEQHQSSWIQLDCILEVQTSLGYFENNSIHTKMCRFMILVDSLVVHVDIWSLLQTTASNVWLMIHNYS